MRVILLPILLLTFLSNYSQVLTASVYLDSTTKKITYDTILSFPELSKVALYQQCGKYFMLGSINKQKGMLSSGDNMLYSDTNEFIVTGIYKTFYRPRISTADYNCIFNLRLRFKDGRVRVTFSDFTLYPYELKSSSFGWFGSNGFGMGSTKTPTMLDGKPVEPMYLKGKTKRRNKLFPLMNRQVNKVMTELIIYLKLPKDKEDNW